MACALLFDITRLAQRRSRRSPTGIDRVVESYFDHFSGSPDHQIQTVLLGGDGLRRARLASATPPMREDSAWSRLASALERGPGLRPAPSSAPWSRLLERASGRWLAPLTPRAQLRRGDVYLNVSHAGLQRPGALRPLRSAGVRTVALIHDLIPIRYPELCSPGAAERHQVRILNVLRDADLAIANSAATAEDLAVFAHERRERLPPICIAPLGVGSAFTPAGPRLQVTRPYFLAVGTLEARKNLTLLLAAWRRICERRAGCEPHLVLVGRRGWEAEAVIDYLDRSPPVRAFVHEVCDLEDEQLAALMRGARALLAPSLAEGFDLPSVEARSVGVPVLASDIQVHRELLQSAEFIDPLDGARWAQAVQDRLDAPSSPPAPERAPTWTDHFAIVEAAMREHFGP